MLSSRLAAKTPPPEIPGLEVKEQIGDGGTSVVFRAIHRNLQREVAVKILQAARSDEAQAAAFRESRLMASFAHPCVVTIHDAGSVDGRNYLVMEFIAGGSLRTKMQPEVPWPLAQAIPLLDNIAQALSYIHERRVLHLDLKPENILYTQDGQPKITDFGLSMPHATANAQQGGSRFQGTLDYCAPEHRSGLPPDEQFDVFSLATMAYELLTGRLPGRVFVPATDRNSALPPALDDVLQRGLARDPGDRYPSVAAFRAALLAAAAERSGAGRYKTLAVAGGIAVLCLLAWGGWYFGGTRSAAAPGPAGSQKLVAGEKPSPKPGGVAHVPAAQPGPPATGTPTVASVKPAVEKPAQPAVVPEVPKPPELPERLVVFYKDPEELALFGENDDFWEVGPEEVEVEHILVETPPKQVLHGLPLPVWPLPQPVLLVQSHSAWGFVYPLGDPDLALRVVQQWNDLLTRKVSQRKNFVKAGDFSGHCLVESHAGELWRGGDAKDWNENRRISLVKSTEVEGESRLLLSNLDKSRLQSILGCYQALPKQFPPGSILVLRYRARSLNALGSLAVYAGIPVQIHDTEMSPIALELRDSATKLNPETPDPHLESYLYRCPSWTIPATDWRTYIIVVEVPPFPNTPLHRKLVIDLAATHDNAADQVWIDDVELFVWKPEKKP